MENFLPADYKKIIRRRDLRYDGRFFFGVTTTKIYCRPACPARPLEKNMIIFRSASEAVLQGYRPCLRCRPETAPDSRILQGTANTVSRALKMMNGDLQKDFSIPKMAAALGVTDRHLRRLFEEHLGASPIEILTSKRLHFSCQLIAETTYPMTEIALSSGFQSVRRFNEAFKNLYRKNPTEFRKGRTFIDHGLNLRLPVTKPFDWQMVLKYLKRHECYGVENVSDSTYTRFIPAGKSFSAVSVRYSETKSALLIQFTNVELTEIKDVLNRLKDLFDTDHNPVDLVSKNGIRVPRSFSSFETAISIIFSQLVSTTQAKETLKKFVLQYGKKLGVYDGAEVYRFPDSRQIVNAKLDQLGITQAKAHAIRELAKQVVSGAIQLNSFTDLKKTREKLLSIKGVGPWTVEMIAMRCLGDSDAFPSKDLIIHRAANGKMFEADQWVSQRAYLTHYIWSQFSEELKKKKVKA